MGKYFYPGISLFILAFLLSGCIRPSARPTPTLFPPSHSEVTVNSPTPFPADTPIPFPTTTPTFVPTPEARRKGMVGIDAGHGGPHYPGAVFRDPAGTGTLVEKDLNLQVALRVAALLRAKGYEVLLTRTEDTTLTTFSEGDLVSRVRQELQARVDLLNAGGADVLISIHFNGYDDPAMKGTETYYCQARPFAKESRRLAELVQRAIISQLKVAGVNAVDRGVKDDASIGQRFGYQHSFILGPELERPSRMTGVIGEALFLTNPEEARLLGEPRILEAIAAGYADAVEAYFQDGEKPTATPTKQPPNPPSGAIWRGPSGKSQVALTFDAGASANPTPKILAVLKAHGIRATMFITGQWAKDNVGLMQQMLADGHELGNHSYSHPYLSRMARPDIEEELERARQQVETVTGTRMAIYFRPPFGEQTRDIQEVATSLGYQTVYWTLDSGDWLEGATAASVKQRVTEGISDGAIVVMHLGSQATAEALEGILNTLQQRGLQPVSLSQLLTP